MTDREKLIKLCEDLETLPCCATYEEQAEYLISHGVTVQEWIPVTERLPETGKIVLCYTKYSEMIVLQREARSYYGWTCGRGSYTTEYITHWMPLPEMPKEG